MKKGKEEDLIHFYIMTSSATDEDTRKYFSDNYNFGFSNIHFFKQANLPVIDIRTKRIMYKEKFLLQMSPDGNGGFYSAVAPLLPEMKKNGVKWIHVIGVDNVLNKLADPVLIGTAELTNS